jgi:hypothetical protein
VEEEEEKERIRRSLQPVVLFTLTPPSNFVLVVLRGTPQPPPGVRHSLHTADRVE